MLLGPLRRAQGGRLLAGPLRAGLLRPRRGLHRRQLHRRQRAAGAQDDPGVRRRASAPSRSSPTSSSATSCCRPRRWCCCWSSSLVIGVAYPAIVQQFVVKPSADEKEAPYIERAIERPGDAYGLDDDRVRRLRAGAATGDEVDTDGRAGRAAQRHRDHPERPAARPERAVRDVHRAPADPQRLRLPREARHRPVHDRRRDPGLRGRRPRAQQRRACRRTRATGSTGTPSTPTATASWPRRPTRSSPASEGGEPNFTTGDLPDHRQHRRRAEPRIYYGELIQHGGQDVYSVVGAPDGADAARVRPARGRLRRAARSTTPTTARAGSSIGSFFRQLIFAIYYRERNFLLSDAVNDNSKVLYVRDPRDRVEKVAPFLEVDGDPYPAVIDGRVIWILDGYTTSDAYPYSEQMRPGRGGAGRADRHGDDGAARRDSSTTSATR